MRLDGGWGGGRSGKRMCCLKHLLSGKKIHKAVTFDPTHISSLDSCIPQYTCDP